MNSRLGVTLVVLVLWTTITVVGSTLTAGGEQTIAQIVTSGIGWPWAIAAAFILAVVLWRGWSDVGLNRGANARAWRLTWLPMVYVLGGFAGATLVGLPPATTILLILINTLLVGFSEELMFRGAFLQALRHATPIWPAVLLTSAAFGAVHSLNVCVTGDLRAALIQSSAAFLSALLFVALRLRTASLWPPIVVHALWDAATLTLAVAAQASTVEKLQTGTDEVSAGSGLVPVLIVLPNAIYGLWLMRGIRTTHADPEQI